MTYRISPPRSPTSEAATASGTGVRDRPLLTIDQTAEFLNISSRKLRRLIASGALPVHRIGQISSDAGLCFASRCRAVDPYPPPFIDRARLAYFSVRINTSRSFEGTKSLLRTSN
jgi:excisionase family DNA binding protein